MIIRKKSLSYVVLIFFILIIAVVFQQIYTSMAEQGINSGGPYDNAAAYPQAVSIIIAFLLFLQFMLSPLISKGDVFDNSVIEISVLKRPITLLVLFWVYLSFLGYLGYHLTTPPMVFFVMILCGMKLPIRTAGISLIVSFLFAYLFEVFLKIVLPGGVFRLNIPW